MARTALTREEVLETAAALVKQHGPDALTMRKLAAELGTAVTSIYWHVGNRESLLDALVERTVADLAAITARGRTPAARIVSVARALRRELRARPHLVAMVHERGLTERMFLPAQRTLAQEVHAAGLRGARAAEAVRAVQIQVVGHVLVERNRERAPVQSPAEVELWQTATTDPPDPALTRALAAPIDPERLFTTSVRALVDGLLTPGNAPAAPTAPAGGRPVGDPERDTGDGGVGRGPYSH
ncbi:MULTISPECIES: TetR/AcrR family transcriptional regulator [Streptomyces]|uniref:TetR-family transcriptional regulator n=1 Tax=Streptomyces venezuelae (strain ATCC 10712 / CBS 650.69 / DSM 40230 / JCM 4526 / NBRC 13096 / PD 04745) TaxID=953739 RepID=F2RFH9_STRVP|nr:TetR family transcriptional regulator [Streptomyces venezuelae]APE20822.1 TetR family transcriptional regulator [Streptomyces venezuelae]QER98215.1 TetR family transcriptional regulator [Streptomyces venezuelae ATCC 10712]CCA54759.1 TetR-family transcriptional regulator [Streptomyces venezuelae ATCC 10712]